MEITEVRIKLMEDSDDRLQAFCSITFDNAFVVRDLKIIDGSNGPFVAMPSRKLTSHCPNCGYKNHLRAHYCNQCGGRLKEERTLRDADGRVKLYADIAHPINAQCREQIQTRVIAEFHAELDRAQQPGYVSRYDEDYDLDFDQEGENGGQVDESRAARAARSPEPPPRTAPRAPSPPPPHFTQSHRASSGVPVASEPWAQESRANESRTVARETHEKHQPAEGGLRDSTALRSGEIPASTQTALDVPSNTSLMRSESQPEPSPTHASPGGSDVTQVPPSSKTGDASNFTESPKSVAPPANRSSLPNTSSAPAAPPRRLAKFGAGIFDTPADG